MTTYRAATWNADNGRPIAAPRDLRRLVRTHDLDLVFVCEAKGYGLLTRVLLPKFRVFNGPDALIVVRRGIPAHHKRIHDLHTGGWERDPKNRHLGLHPGRTMPSLLIGKPGHQFKAGVVHLPPPPHDGPKYPARRQAFRNGLSALNSIARRWSHNGKWLMAGDWNAVAGRPDMVDWLDAVEAKAAGAGVDYPVWHGLHVTNVRRVPAGGDHGHACLFDVTV